MQLVQKDKNSDIPVGVKGEASSVPDPAADDGISKATKLLFMLFITLCLSFLLWAGFAKLDIFSTAQGEVVPSTKVKSVQHLEGGIVNRILVREGQIVEKDEPLVEMKTTASDADVQELKVRIAGLRVEIARLEAEAEGREDIQFNKDLLENHPNLVQNAKKLFRARRERLANDQKKQSELIIQRQQEIDEIQARIRNQKNRLELLNEQISISEDLLKDELTSRYNHLDLLKESSNLKSSIEENGEAARQAETALKVEEVRLTGILGTYREEVETDLEESRMQYNGYLERMRKFEDSLSRTVVRAPVEGVIKTLYVVTEGGVIKPGETLLDIVPGGDLLIVEAKLPTQDIGYISIGQKAVIKLNSADARRFGSLNGEVVNISPDTLVTEKGLPYYNARISTERGYFENNDFRYQLYPGMIVMVSIHTGQRTVLEYIISPFMSSMDNALTER
ncbi:HlyD family type I secretion periplasmic adaptor subunit [Thermodesulfobacteriota bacterium]